MQLLVVYRTGTVRYSELADQMMMMISDYLVTKAAKEIRQERQESKHRPRQTHQVRW